MIGRVAFVFMQVGLGLASMFGGAAALQIYLMEVFSLRIPSVFLHGTLLLAGVSVVFLLLSLALNSQNKKGEETKKESPRIPFPWDVAEK